MITIKTFRSNDIIDLNHEIEKYIKTIEYEDITTSMHTSAVNGYLHTTITLTIKHKKR